MRVIEWDSSLSSMLRLTMKLPLHLKKLPLQDKQLPWGPWLEEKRFLGFITWRENTMSSTVCAAVLDSPMDDNECPSQ